MKNFIKKSKKYLSNKSVFLEFNLIKVSTLFVRGLGITSRFLLTFLITKNISLEFQGDYTLIVSSITLLIIFFGFDFYVYAGRVIIKEPSKEIFFLKNMMVFYLVSYVLLFFVLKFLYSSFHLNFVPFWILYSLIILEHLGQEFFRIYLALRKPLLANILLFFRTGLWAFLIVIGFLFVKGFEITMASILYSWFICALFTCIIGFWNYPGIQGFFKEKVDFTWIKKGLFVGLTMFASTMCLKIIEYSDRYLIAIFLDKKDVGIYSFYFQLSNVINVVIFTMYISFMYPDIIDGVYKKSHNSIKSIKKTLIKKTLFLVAVFGIAFFILSPYLLNFINRPELNTYSSLYYLLLFSTVFLNLSFFSHYVIIGEEKEKLIFKSTFYACLTNIGFNLCLIPLIGIYGSAFALLSSNVVLFIFNRKYEKECVASW